jgi:hypothetical protein
VSTCSSVSAWYWPLVQGNSGIRFLSLQM